MNKEYFNMMRNQHFEINDNMLRFFFDVLGIFNKDEYFSKEKWKKIKAFKNVDPTEIKCAFLSYWFKEATGFITFPKYGSYCNLENNEDAYNNYIASYNELFDNYNEWLLKKYN